MSNIATPIPALKLNDGTAMPMLAYGTGTAWYKKGEESVIDQDLVKSIKEAVKMGYRHLDGAEMYKTEPELGIAIRECGVPRDDLYVVTKVNHNVRDIEAALRASLGKLGVSWVDLYLIHSPFWAQTDEELQQAWATMEKVQQLGLTKSIGVSNFLPQHLSTILKTAKTLPACNQIEFHAYLQRPSLLALHKEYNITTTAYAPLTPITKASPGPVDDLLKVLAKKYAVSEAEVCLRWCVDQDVVPITTSAKPQRLSDYLRITKFKLSSKEVKELNEKGSEKNFRAFWNHKLAENDWS